jgi:hypothetical protein
VSLELEGLQNAAGEAEQAPMDSLFPFAIPTPHSEARDEDDTEVLRTCSASGSTCVLAAFFPPAGGACLGLTALLHGCRLRR